MPFLIMLLFILKTSTNIPNIVIYAYTHMRNICYVIFVLPTEISINIREWRYHESNFCHRYSHHHYYCLYNLKIPTTIMQPSTCFILLCCTICITGFYSNANKELIESQISETSVNLQKSSSK